jgi:hypothetical protein
MNMMMKAKFNKRTTTKKERKIQQFESQSTKIQNETNTQTQQSQSVLVEVRQPSRRKDERTESNNNI